MAPSFWLFSQIQILGL